MNYVIPNFQYDISLRRTCSTIMEPLSNKEYNKFNEIFLLVDDMVAEYLTESFDDDGGKLWSCSVCQFNRPLRAIVARHIEQKHLNLCIPCDFCDSKFTRRDKYRAHMRHVHMECPQKIL